MKTLLSLTALAAAFAAAPALGQQPSAPATIVVHTADLDLSSRAGVAALDRRINAAVALACGDASDVDVHGKNVAARCRAEAHAQAAAQRSQALAFARHAGQTTLAAQ